MSDEPAEHNVRSYRQIAIDTALPGGYAVFAALCGFVALVYTSFVLHLYSPVYTGHITESIAHEQIVTYVGNVAVWGGLSLYGIFEYARWDHVQ